MVTKADVLELARLARLHLDADEVDRLVTELSTILEHVEELGAADIAGVEAVGGAAEGAAPLRADAPGADALQRPLSELAPGWSDGFFTVPRLAALDGDAEDAS